MEALLNALRAGDETEVIKLAPKLLMTWRGTINKGQVSEFEAYAPCKVLITGGCLHGIQYHDKTFMLN